MTPGLLLGQNPSDLLFLPKMLLCRQAPDLHLLKILDSCDTVSYLEQQPAATFPGDIGGDDRNASGAKKGLGQLHIPRAQGLRGVATKRGGPTENLGLQVSDLTSQRQDLFQKFGVRHTAIAESIRSLVCSLR